MRQREPGRGASVGERLRAVRKALGMNQTELAGAVGITQSSVAAYESDERKPPLPVLLALEHVLRVNHKYVLEGDGTPIVSAGKPEKPTILADDRDLQRLERAEGAEPYYLVPYLRDAASAGTGLIMDEQVAGYCVIHRRVAPNPERLRCVRISGDSMAPTLTDGSIVAVDVTPVPIHVLEGKIVCSRTVEGGVVIKRLRVRGRYALLFSDNEDRHSYPPIVVDLRELEEPIVGQVVWAWVDLR